MTMLRNLALALAGFSAVAGLGCRHHAMHQPQACADPYGAECMPMQAPGSPVCFPACETGAACDVCGDDHPPYADEWICDGGDADPEIWVNKHGAEIGLNLEDAAAIYDSVDSPGERLVAPSNRECVYAPRFAAVRKVYTPIAEHANDGPIGMLMEDPIVVDEAVDPIYVAELDDPIADFTVPTPPAVDYVWQEPGAMSTETALLIAEERLGAVVRRGFVVTGVYTGDERLIIEEMMQAAEIWTHDAAVQAVVSGEAASEVVGDRAVQQLHLFEHEGETAIRICKLASPKAAARGDTVEFTLRFDNVSDQTARNVDIIDNLTTRLQYIEATQESSLKAEFFTEPNDGGSLTLRWRLAEPLEPGDGGYVTFRCKVL